MDLPLNDSPPLIMHIDLNSCFAIIEQQANPLIRHRPVAVAAYDTPGGIVLAASHEAKTKGIKLMVKVREAKTLSPDVVVMMPDPEKYFDAHRRFKEVLLKYTSDITPKSIDEFVIDFKGSLAIQNGLSLVDIGKQIKLDIKKSLGEYVTVNIGIAPNRFLAKVASGLHKPDGLDVITADNLRSIFSQLDLVDLPGINRRYAARLHLSGIHNPLQFLDASIWQLRHEVFHGITGYYWYLRLRGHEIDSVDFGRKSFGHEYALSEKTKDPDKLLRLLMKLCEKTGRRLRRHGFAARGVRLWLAFENRSRFVKNAQSGSDIYSTQDIYLQVSQLLSLANLDSRVTNIGVTVFNLKETVPLQLGLFQDTRLDTRSLAKASDMVNDRYGEFTVTPARMANMQEVILKRVAFGNVKGI